MTRSTTHIPASDSCARGTREGLDGEEGPVTREGEGLPLRRTLSPGQRKGQGAHCITAQHSLTPRNNLWPPGKPREEQRPSPHDAHSPAEEGLLQAPAGAERLAGEQVAHDHVQTARHEGQHSLGL